MAFQVKFQDGRTATFQNKPTDQDIDDVAKKFGITPGQPSAQPQAPQPRGIERVTQPLARGLATVFGGAKIGEAIGTGIAKLGLTGLTKEQRKEVAPGPSAKEVGIDVLRTGATFIPVTKPVRALARGVSAITGKTAQVAGEAIVGTKGKGVLRAAVSKPKIQRKVIAGEITTKTIADKIGKFAKKTQEASKKKLTIAREKITGTAKGETIAKSVNTVMQKAIKDKPFSTEEERLVNKFVTFIRKEIKPTGTVTKAKLDDVIKRVDDLGFFKGTDKFRNSDKVINSVRKTLRETTKKGNPKFAKLLETASKKDIPFFEKLGRNIVGKDGDINADLLQNKINQLVKAIDDPNTRQGSLELLRELSKRVGAKADFLDELEIFSRSQPLLKDIPGISSPLETLKQLGTRGLARGARKAEEAREGIARQIRR